MKRVNLEHVRHVLVDRRAADAIPPFYKEWHENGVWWREYVVPGGGRVRTCCGPVHYLVGFVCRAEVHVHDRRVTVVLKKRSRRASCGFLPSGIVPLSEIYKSKEVLP